MDDNNALKRQLPSIAAEEGQASAKKACVSKALDMFEIESVSSEDFGTDSCDGDWYDKPGSPGINTDSHYTSFSTKDNDQAKENEEKEEDENKYSCTPPIPATIKSLTDHIDVSSWNMSNAENVYDAFKIKLHKVHPKYFLYSPSSYELPGSRKTIEDILVTSERKKGLPLWPEVVPKIMKVLNVFEGCEDSMENMENVEMALQHLIGKMEPPNREPHLFLVPLVAAVREILDGMTRQESSKSMSKTYLNGLYNVFLRCIQPQRLPVWRENKPLQFILHGTPMDVKPDFLMSTMDAQVNCLVVEVKGCGMRGQYDSHKGDGIRAQKNNPDTGEDTSDEKCSHSPPGNCTGHEMRPGDQGASGESCPSQRELQDQNGEIMYRCLDRKAREKVKHFMPQLFGDMLAIMHRNKHRLNFGPDYENMMFGMSMRGYKVKFVSLVISDPKMLLKPPTLSDLGSPGVQCDLFMTRELNLLKEKAITTFFQLLYGILYITS